MTAAEILKELESYGEESIKNTLMKHGAKEPFFGVKVENLKKIIKKTKKNHELSLELYKTGNSDAMYLAGLMADETKITEAQLDEWVENAYWYYLSEHAVPCVAADTNFGFELGLKWIQSNKEHIASAGWSTLINIARTGNNINIEEFSKLLDLVEKDIHTSKNRVRYTMNGFVIASGTFISELTQKSIKVAKNIGKINVEMGGTACKVPLANDYLENAIKQGIIGKKRKSARA